MVRIPTNRPPTHPGEMLLTEFLEPLGLTQKHLAESIHVPYQRINEIINGKRGVTPSTALRLAKFFGVSSDFWLNLQLRWDLYHVQKQEGELIEQIQVFSSDSVEKLNLGAMIASH
ncbi:HigA family addiction module antitoxin [Chamaesiphon sp. VAR_48_metabat_135_sub]|uniref:HigA family addiction module antitoxin n=1 Tax=Chamaesiphon sp. VAR_48_metabat_135_sub TaxID=2964699 RepID=UPI00286CEB0F|nr:HigA family addiction module antitoxin [Chamaesiphon sp. VAR_48_metabat_135_sub]